MANQPIQTSQDKVLNKMVANQLAHKVPGTMANQLAHKVPGTMANQQRNSVLLVIMANQPIQTSQDKVLNKMVANQTQKNFRSLRISIGTLVFWLSRNLKVAIEASLAVFGLVERIGGGQSVSAICAT